MLFLDFETLSRKNLKETSVVEYSSESDITLFCWATGDGEVKLFSPVRPEYFLYSLDDFKEDVANAELVIAHNAYFDRSIYESCAKKYGLPPVKRWACTQFISQACNLPSRKKSLSALGEFFKVESPKESQDILMEVIENGVDFLKSMSNDKWAEFCSYGKSDILALREVYKGLPEVLDSWIDEWNASYRINRRGIGVDEKLVDNALIVAEQCKTEANEGVAAHTEGHVQNLSSPKQITTYLSLLEGREIKSSSDQALTNLYNNKRTTQETKKFIDFIREHRTSSNTRWKALKKGCYKSSVHETFNPRAATSGRWTSRGVQMQNLPARFDWDSVISVRGASKVAAEAGFDALDVPLKDSLRGLLRTAFIARKNKLLHISDYSQLEERLGRWICQDSTALQNYRKGFDPYVMFASRNLFNKIPREITGEERSIAKQAVLSLGYGVGHVQFEQRCLMAGVHLKPEMFKISSEASASKYVVDVYRTSQSKIPAMWRKLHDAMDGVWTKPNTSKHIVAGTHHGWGTSGIRLENIDGDYIKVSTTWGYENYFWKPFRREEKREYEGETYVNNAFKFIGTEGIEKDLYGAKMYAILTQGSAHQIIAKALVDVERAFAKKGTDYGVVNLIHDELVVECDKEDGHLIDQAMVNAAYDGLPLEVESHQSKRFGKDYW